MRPPAPSNDAPRPTVLAFLDDSKQHPDDDTPRLVLADWLEEHGDPRGELVRLQVQAAALPPDEPRRLDLARREEQLLRQHVRQWLGSIADLSDRWQFRRGLLWVETSVIRLLNTNVEALAATEAWAWVEGLRVNGLAGVRGGLAAVLPLTAGVSVLDLSRNRLGTEGASLLAGWPHLAGLRWLDLHWNGLGDASVDALADSPHLASLTGVNLFFNHITARGAAALARSPHLALLAHLDLQANRLGSEGARALAASPSLPCLTHLNLENNRIGTAGAEGLASSSQLSRLVALRLRFNDLGADGVQAVRQRFGDAVQL